MTSQQQDQLQWNILMNIHRQVLIPSQEPQELVYVCPQCGGKKIYKVKRYYEMAVKKKSKCQICKDVEREQNHLQWVEDTRKKITINPLACKMMDDWNSRLGLSFQHGNNGGEYVVSTGSYLTYFLDGYDEKHGLVFEYDEPHHEEPEQKEKDQRREYFIFSYFFNQNKPIRIIRYSQQRHELYEVFYAFLGMGERRIITENQLLP